AEMERFGTASLVTRSTSDVTNIQMFLSLLLRLGVTAPLMAVAGLVLSSLTGGELSSVLSLAIPALIIGVGVILIFVSRYSVTLRQRIDRLNKIFLETLEGVRVIRAFNRQGKEMERFSQANGELASMTILSACGLLCADFQHPGALPAFCREAVPKQPGMITAVVCKALD
ncbi:MAG: ABC transporter transmembrane domain-containing protein, partial [Oscillospiraceae bacterium]